MHRKALTAVFLASLVVLARPKESAAQVFKTNLFPTRASAALSVLVQANGPIGQSFTATTNSIGWVALFLEDANATNGVSATLHVNLRNYTEASNGVVGGNVIASSRPSTLTNGHQMVTIYDATRFLFPTNLPVAVGTKYWLEIVSDSGDEVRARYYHFSYSGGDVIAWGTNMGTIAPYPEQSLWDMGFAVGTVIKYPEFKNVRIETANAGVPNELVLRGEVEGVLGQEFTLDISSDFVHWVPFTTNAFAASPTLVELPFTAQVYPPRQFFRARYLNQK